MNADLKLYTCSRVLNEQEKIPTTNFIILNYCSFCFKGQLNHTGEEMYLVI